jgi:hypothetical protein
MVQCACLISIIGKRCHEYRRNRAACVDEVPVEFDPAHVGHLDIGDQAGCFGETGGREKIGRRRENVDSVAHRSHESGHGLTKEPIVIDDRNHYIFHHAACSHSLARRAASELCGRAASNVQGCHRGTGGAP